MASESPLPLNDQVLRLLDVFQALDEPTLPALFEALYRTRYTGEVTFHFGLGQPRMVEFGQPVKLPLGTPAPAKDLTTPPG